MADAKSKSKLKKIDVDSMAVVRDPAFVRLCADEVSILALGRDLDLAFLTASPIIVSRMERGSGEDRELGYELSASMAEVARIRLSPAAALQTGMALLQSLVRGDMVKLDEFEEAIREMISEARVAAPDEGVK